MLRKFEKRLDRVVTRAFNIGLRQAARAATLPPFMVPLGQGKNSRPPNSPPGPIGIRSGTLRRSLGVKKAKKKGSRWIGGIKADLNKAPYARIHELGGKTSAHVIVPKKKSVLRWAGIGPSRNVGKRGKPIRKQSFRGGGFDIWAHKVNHPGSKIPARPFLTPARDAAVPNVIALVDDAIQEAGRRFF